MAASVCASSPAAAGAVDAVAGADAAGSPTEFDGYRLERCIGHGAMGKVFLAHDELLDRPVAVKFITAAHAGSSARRRFLQEARAIARLQHPNVVSVYRVGEAAGQPYLVSEYVRGTPLDALELPMVGDLALRIAMDMALGLAAAHRRGVVHRDIKPANVMLSDDGQVKLLDFGIAKLVGQDAAEREAAADAKVSASPAAPAPVEPPRTAPPRCAAATVQVERTRVTGAPLSSDQRESTAVTRVPSTTVELERTGPTRPAPTAGAVTADLTQAGEALGTPRYMAPEVWRGEPATFRSDVYSFGALLYRLCSGRPPHDGRTVDELRAQVLRERATPLAEVAPQVLPALAAIVDRCLETDPKRRYGTGGELRARLAELLPGARGRAVPEGNPYRGLQAFEAEHRDVFFGRDSEIRMVLDRLRSASFVLVAGDSGVGKSSLCRAGVLPRLQSGLSGDRQWDSVLVVPGRRPVAALAAALAPQLAQPERDVAQTIRTDPAGVARDLRARQGASAGLVLLLDQLEELVTVADRDEAAAAAEMLGWLVLPSSAVRVLATARGDFLSRLATLPGIGDELSRALYFLRPLSAERVREVIVGPAQKKGVRFESSELVEQLVDAAIRGEGGLPLLQFALAELWDARDRGSAVIGQQTVEELGGVVGALSRHADTVLERLCSGERRVARSVLLRLVTAAGTRARRSGADLGDDDPQVHQVLTALVRGRLIVARDGADGTSYEIAHETLVRGWGTLAGWLSADADAARARERLHRAVEEWQRLGRAREGLLSPRQLEQLCAVEGLEPLPQQQELIRASRRAHRQARLRRLVLWIGVPSVLLLGYLGFWLAGEIERDRQVASEVRQATSQLAEARAARALSAGLRGGALLQFASGRLDEGERLWGLYRAEQRRVAQRFGRAGQRLETALLLDRERPDVRALLADTLYERALFAEARHDRLATEELLARLALYDDGSRQARWHAPAQVTLRTTPRGARVELLRYVAQEDGRLQAEPIPLPSQRLDQRELAPGSYLAEVSAEQRASVRLPFSVDRAEQRALELRLPRLAEVPEGFVYVPAGRSFFGTAASDEQRRDFLHTVPIHARNVGAFLIARTETTFAEWLEFLEALPEAERRRRTPAVNKGGFQGAMSLERNGPADWTLEFQPTEQRYRARSGEPVVYRARQRRRVQDWLRFPVFGISVEDALAYARWLDRTGLVPGARLCTELEWERAARGADGRPYPHGTGLSEDDANHDETYGKVPAAMGPDEVGAHPTSRSPFGLDDMAGNVWEWTVSSLRPKEYAARGGSYYFGASSSRSTDREVTEPSFRDVSVGLRICADAPTRRAARVEATGSDDAESARRARSAR